jgi:hypothetical protein
MGKRIMRRLGASLAIAALSGGAAFGLDIPNPLDLFGGKEDRKSEEGGRPTPPPSGASVSCPEIFVDSGAASLRVPAGADNESVRYQLSLGDMARDCSVQGEDVLVRVGVQGAVVLGPVGQPGAYAGSVVVSVRRQKDEEVVKSKTYRINASVPAGQSRGEFQFVAEPLAVPYLGPNAAEDYEILVGFEGGASEHAASRPKERKRRAR